MGHAKDSFEWDHNDMAWFPRTMMALNDALNAPVFKCGERERASLKAFKDRMQIVPMIPCRPWDLIEDGWTLVVKTDGCDVGIGGCLLLVQAPEDEDITPVTLQTRQVRIIATFAKKLTQEEAKWLTFEIEAYGMYTALRKWSGFIMQVGIANPDMKIQLMMDSTTALSNWMKVSVPGKIDFACAKEKRFRGCALTVKNEY